jgi:hypothetical protein
MTAPSPSATGIPKLGRPGGPDFWRGQPATCTFWLGRAGLAEAMSRYLIRRIEEVLQE